MATSSPLLPADSKRILSASPYAVRTSSSRIRPYHLLLLPIYLVCATFVVTSIGVPYVEFMEMAESKGLLWNFDDYASGVLEEGTAAFFRANLVNAADRWLDEERPQEIVGWFGVREIKKGQGYMDWMEMSIEEYDEAKKASKHTSILDALPKNMRAPHRHAPSFWPTLFSGLLIVFHILLVLLQHWVVKFDVFMNYSPCKDLDTATHVLLHLAGKSEQTGQPTVGKKGKRLVVPLERRIIDNDVSPSPLPSFQYHKRNFVYSPSSGSWTKIRANTSMATSIFQNWTGLATPSLIQKAQNLYGKNETEIPSPSFLELYRKQLLSPFTVFQLFCVCLWMLDGMWQYSLFTLFMIFTFEGTVVFSRMKSLSSLKGMGSKDGSNTILVHRKKVWSSVQVSELVPGDIVSIKRNRKSSGGKDQDSGSNAVDELIPADLLLLGRGISVVVNEASLTGESVPQMKEGLTDFTGEDQLEMRGRHKMNLVYGGTKIMQIKISTEEDSGLKFSLPFDGGAPAFVLRTGFLSSQGKLVRMIEGGQSDQNRGHERDTALLLLLLFFFALASSGYVLREGMKNEGRSKYELLLHCVLILTSVIPPELPMQMALAVNSSLMKLMKMQIFCTEPFRVPIAGRVGCCLFDKTGTLTTDELVAVGVCSKITSGNQERNPSLSSKQKQPIDMIHPMTKLPYPAHLVLASCHSLVLIDSNVTGDPMELAALKASRWTVTDDSGSAGPMPATKNQDGGKSIVMEGRGIDGLKILGRHHFSSKLQRMSAVTSDKKGMQYYAVCKGSPEAIGARLACKPDGYVEASKRLSKRGYRVIALSYRSLAKDEVKGCLESRTVCEEGGNMIFAGFVAFTCRVRKDTKNVLNHLKEGGMNVIMVTGDALLTAAHVAKETCICEPDEDMLTPGDLQKLLLSKKSEKKIILILEKDESGGMFWQSYDDESRIADLVVTDVPNLYEKYDLAITGKNLAAAVEFDENIKKVLWYFKIFARMSPVDKELVINCLHSQNHLSMMCGDGANDVGALKSSDVGVALLSGFGDVNVDRSTEESKETDTTTALISQDEMDQLRKQPVRVLKSKIRELGVEPDSFPDLTEKEDLIKLYRIKATEAAVKKHDRKNAQDKLKLKRNEAHGKMKENMKEKQAKMQLRIQELERQGEVCFSLSYYVAASKIFAHKHTTHV
uniref:P-type ATPase A domain-containing protein n=1 Tax=Corethron hystrix TaxID=216773 RepID=A0A7S1BRA1_9STRA|mmetsp:Transcript_35810/g.83437  ORF Transcript_35810/g.83437 Transcript_35810/m.83437 type:complete len:1178 (+) Transcript_35810:110-3643(+)